MDDFRRALLLRLIGLVDERELPGVATEALVAGLDGQLLRELAGLPRSERSSDLLFDAARELGVRIPDEFEAREELARIWSADILSGRLDALAGARLIWQEVQMPFQVADRESGLEIFAGLASEWDEHPEHAPEYDREIRLAAAGLLRE